MANHRFVILEHDHPFLHWDLMLEDGSALTTWRLLEPVESGKWLPAEDLPVHRIAYLTYEGPVSNNRGNVRRIAQGEYSEILTNPSSDVVQYRLHNCSLAHTAFRRIAASGRPEWRFD